MAYNGLPVIDPFIGRGMYPETCDNLAKGVRTPDEALDALPDMPDYRADLPVCFGNQTDVFSTPETTDYYSEVLNRYGDSDYQNPLVFVTKQLIPESFIKSAAEVRQPVVFYTNYSALGGTAIEPDIDDAALRENFLRLEAHDMPRVHYWQPFLPLNATPDKIHEVIDFTAQHASCSLVKGLQLDSSIRETVAPYWPQVNESEYDLALAGDFWPVNVRLYLGRYARKAHADYPVFSDASCSLAFTLRQSDSSGVFDSRACHESSCPSTQRTRCIMGRTVATLPLIQVNSASHAIAPSPNRPVIEVPWNYGETLQHIRV